MNLRYCRSCGEQKRLRWPRGEPVFCSMRCAAEAFASYMDCGDVECAYCPDCGETMPQCFCDDDSQEAGGE